MATVQDCREAASSLKQALELVQLGGLGSETIGKWVDDIIPAYITMFENELLLNSDLSVQEKQVFTSTTATCYSVKQQMEACLRRGAGIATPAARLKWDDLQSAFKGRIRTGVVSNIDHLDVSVFLDDARSIFMEKIKLALQEHNSLKVNVTLSAEYSKIQLGEKTDEIFQTITFSTKNQPIYENTNLVEWYGDNVVKVIEKKVEEFQERDSGWALRPS